MKGDVYALWAEEDIDGGDAYWRWRAGFFRLYGMYIIFMALFVPQLSTFLPLLAFLPLSCRCTP